MTHKSVISSLKDEIQRYKTFSKHITSAFHLILLKL